MRRRTLGLVGCVAMIVAFSGCEGPGTEPSAEQSAEVAAAEHSADEDLPEPVRRAVAVAREIEADPRNAEAILERHGLTAEAFDELLYEISSDPELSTAYNAALGR